MQLLRRMLLRMRDGYMNATNSQSSKAKVLKKFPAAYYSKNPVTEQHVIFRGARGTVMATSWIGAVDAWKEAARR